MLHAKIVTVDGAVACVGSANVNSRSMAHDDEVCAVVFDPGIVALLDRHADEDLERSERSEEGRWHRRSLRQRVVEGATRVIEARL